MICKPLHSRCEHSYGLFDELLFNMIYESIRQGIWPQFAMVHLVLNQMHQEVKFLKKSNAGEQKSEENLLGSEKISLYLGS